MKEIFDKWVGKKVDYDNGFGYQCVDWARQFAKETSNPIGSFSGSALAGWNTGSPFQNTKWVKIPYTTDIKLFEGDIFFLDKTKSNPYGHVGVIEKESDGAKIYVVEQNAGTGNGDGVGNNAITRRTIENFKSRGALLGVYRLPKPLMEDNTVNSSTFKYLFEEEVNKGYIPIFSNHEDYSLATIADVKYLIEVAFARAKK